jgi:hypothetical protein
MVIRRRRRSFGYGRICILLRCTLSFTVGRITVESA